MCDYFYYGILFFSLFFLLFSFLLPKASHYKEGFHTFSGIVRDYHKKDNQYVIKVYQKENLIVYSDEFLYDVGDKIQVSGDFFLPKQSTTSNLFQYREYLKRKNTYYLVSSKEIVLLKKNKRIYYSIKKIIRKWIDEDPYLSIFLLGDKSYVSSSILKSYQENGISHLFAISGMHISLLSSLLTKLLRKKFSEEKTYFILCFFFVFYLLLIGLSPSVLRGVFFFIFFQGNQIYYFYIKKENLFLLILSLSILVNPFSIMDAGFQFSYLISFSLLCFSKELSSNNYFISLMKVSLLSFLVGIPICIYHYYQINLMSFFYNLLFVPFISLFLFPFSFISFFIKPLRGIFHFFVFWMEKISLFLSHISFGKLLFPKVSIFIYLIYLFLILLFCIMKKKKILFLFLALLFVHFLIPFFRHTSITYLDVGQGDSTLLQLNHQNILIDTGGNHRSSLSTNLFIPYFKSKGISSINSLILSHGDYDHMGEAINLVENYKVKKVIFNCGEFNELEKELVKILEKKKIPYYSCIQELNVDDYHLYFLNTKEYDNENDNSNVIYTEINGYKFMFMGDAGIEKEKDIIDQYNLNDIDVLKVGHHGSKTSSSRDFINVINPKYSIISVGKNNRYGHPNKEVLNILKDSKIFRTDKDGSIIFKIKNNQLNNETSLS